MIRLQRIGKKKSPSYRLVASEKIKDTQGRALEILGIYNPVANPKVIDLKVEKIKELIKNGAQASETVHNLLLSQGIVSGNKKKSVAISKKRQAKIDEKKAADEEAKKQAAEAAKAAEEEAKAAEEAEKAAAEAKATEEAEASEAPTEEAKEPADAEGSGEVKEEKPAEKTEEKKEA